MQPPGAAGSGRDPEPHHPSPLGYLPVPLEAELFEQVGRAGVEIGAALRGAPFDLLGVGLDEAAPSRADGGQHGTESRPRDPTAPVLASGEDAADPPVGQLVQALGVGLRVFDVRKLRRRPVLTPADAFIAVVDQNLVHRPVANVGLLGPAVPGNGMAPADPLGMKTHAPAAAPDTVVGLHQPGKVVPGVRAEWPRHVGAGRCHDLSVRRGRRQTVSRAVKGRSPSLARPPRSAVARAVPPVASTSSTISTRSPGSKASVCTSIVAVPYSSW